MRIFPGEMKKARHGTAAMRSRTRVAIGAGLGVALALVLGVELMGRSQSPGTNVGPPGSMRVYYPDHSVNGMSPADTDGENAVEMERRMNALNVERQKEMVSDADKLLKLAKELNDEVAAQSHGNLSYEQLRKLAEIEKLARSVKDRMADGVQQPSPPMSPAPVFSPTP